MPSISRIRFTNVVYDNGHKRYIDTTFRFDGYNGILLLENGAGKTVFVQTLIQAVLPRKTVAQRKIQETLQLNNAIAHIAVEWILEDQPRRYALTAVSLFMNSREQLASQEFALEYTPSSPVRLDTLPFVRREKGKARPATKEEMASYFRGVAEHAMAARFFSENDTLTAYGQYLEEHFKIIPSEWNKIAAINETEGGVEGYFENCRTTSELVERLLIPTVEEGCLAASGSQTGNGFAELFESQRDHVKQQLRLEKRIAEMQGVLEQLEAYTAVQKTFFDAKESLRALNSRLRTYYDRICQDETARHNEEGALKEEQAALSARQAETERLLAACDVVEAREACDAARTASDGAEQHFQQAERERLANLREGQNLTLSRYKRDQAHTEALLADRQQALASLEADAATQQLLANLKQNSAALHGWFCQAEAKEQENLKQTADAMEDVRRQQDSVKAEQEKQEEAYHRILSEVKGGEGQIRELLRQQEKMEKELFADSVHQEAADVQRRWQRDLAQVRQEAAGYEKNQAFYEEEGRKAAAFIVPAEKEEAVRQQELWQLGLALSQTDTLARNLLDRLQQWPHCANIADDTASLYRRSDARQTVEQCRQSVELYRSRLAAARQQEAKLAADLRQLGDYLELQQQHRAILDKNGQLMKEADGRQHTLAGLAREAGRLQARYEERLRQHGCIETRCSQLKQKLYWSEVQDAEPVPDGRDYDVLAEERRRLKSRLDGANESRGRLEAQIEGARQTAAKLAADMERLRQSAELPLDEHFVYPDDGDEREVALLRERPGLVQACRQADKAWRAARSQYDQAAGRLKTEENRYQARYEAMPALDGPVTSVRAKAQELTKSLKEALATAARKQQAAQAEGRKLAALHQQLAVKNERLLFAADDVPEGLVEGLEALHTAKELAQAVTPVLEQAEGLRQEVDERRSACDNQREIFRAYCETAVADVKLRSSIVDGIRYKREYMAYLEWQDKSRARLERVISVSEEERKGHYAHLEHMINHMILHLQDVCNGLGELAAKTRIKIGETTKDIFQIQVPPWQEAAARTSIRTYLNDLTTELDQADGEEERQETKVRAILEKKLRTQQVLRCIFGHQAIKVRCRKATSGNTFSERPFSWEESNKWSGGEMWSKNMALFLGCLNYLSEKRCHLRRAKYNTRVVIADNPFGKASSDHVLSPVFFIAKQLGFQIIALTAHQEGSFIRKYFPVVYSCRFADMANKKGKVLVPDKEVKTAFFEEHHPESLARLDEYEQLGLF